MNTLKKPLINTFDTEDIFEIKKDFKDLSFWEQCKESCRKGREEARKINRAKSKKEKYLEPLMIFILVVGSGTIVIYLKKFI